MKKTVYFVTGNAAKIEEVESYLKVHSCPNLELRFEALDIEEIQTLDQQSIVRDKAKKAWEFFKKPVLVDDGAIYFARYNNFPGPLAKFVAQGLGFEGLKRIIEEGDRATRILYLAYCDGGEPVLFEGRSEGTLIIPDQIGDPRFPYNSFFIPDGAEQTTEHMKHLIAQHGKEFYRIKALQKFLAWFGKEQSR